MTTTSVPAPTRRRLCMKANIVSRGTVCAFCPAEIRLAPGIRVFVDGTWDPVCRTCARRLEPALAASEALVSAASAVGRGLDALDARDREPAADYVSRDGSPIVFTVHHYKGAKMPWVSRITGRDPRFRFARERLPLRPTSTSPDGEFGDYATLIPEPGLFQAGEAKTKSGYWLAWRVGRALKMKPIAEDRVDAIVELVERGETFDAARRATGKRSGTLPAGVADGVRR